MAKLELNEVASLANTLSAKQVLNDNFARIEEALDNTLSRDGSLPNQMGADIDLNDNDLLNVKSVDAKQYLLNGVPISQSVSYADKHYSIYDGTGVDTDFLLEFDPGSLGNLEVTISGVMQRPGIDYNYTGTTLTFVDPPPAAVKNILVRYDQALSTGVTDAAAVFFQQSGLGAEIRTMLDKLREVEISITDFGGDPTGVAACDGAWAAAQASLPLSGGVIKFPKGRYRFLSPIVIGNAPPLNPSTLNGVTIKGDGTGTTATTMLENDGATTIFYDGPSLGTDAFLRIAGPISGVKLENFLLDMQGINGVPIDSQRSFHQTIDRVVVTRWRGNFMYVANASSPLGPVYGGAAPIDHSYYQFVGQNPDVGAHGIDIGSGAGNLNQLRFFGCFFDRYNDPNTIGARWGYCDHVQMYSCHIAQTGSPGASGISHMVRSQPGFPNFPVNIEIYGGSQAGGCTYDTTLETWDGGPYAAITFYGYKTADGAVVPPKTANGGVDAPHFMFRGWTDNGVQFGWGAENFGSNVVAAATIAPQTRVIHLSGSAVITNITVPHLAFSGPGGIFRLQIIPVSAGPLSLATGGNIAQNYSMTNLKPFWLTYSESTGFWMLDE